MALLAESRPGQPRTNDSRRPTRRSEISGVKTIEVGLQCGTRRSMTRRARRFWREHPPRPTWDDALASVWSVSSWTDEGRRRGAAVTVRAYRRPPHAHRPGHPGRPTPPSMFVFEDGVDGPHAGSMWHTQRPGCITGVHPAGQNGGDR
jgi:hypothetical protein